MFGLIMLSDVQRMFRTLPSPPLWEVSNPSQKHMVYLMNHPYDLRIPTGNLLYLILVTIVALLATIHTNNNFVLFPFLFFPTKTTPKGFKQISPSTYGFKSALLFSNDWGTLICFPIVKPNSTSVNPRHS